MRRSTTKCNYAVPSPEDRACRFMNFVNDSFVVVNQGRATVDAKAHQQNDVMH